METWHQMKTRHLSERKALMEAYAAKGISQNEAARQLGMTGGALHNQVTRLGVDWPTATKYKNEHTARRRAMLMRFLSDGNMHTTTEIADAVGVDNRTALTDLRALHEHVKQSPHSWNATAWEFREVGA